MNKITRSADANWKGNLDEGHGLVSVESRAFTEETFTFKKRVHQFDHETNPEELIAAAAASCFAMALSKTLQDDDQVSSKLRVKADVSLSIEESGPRLTEIQQHATEALMPYWEEKIAEKVERLNEAYNKDKAIVDTAKCVLAAANGRVEMVCVASDQREPGICHPEKMKVEFVEHGDAGCVHDLLDTIAYETIQHGGEAFVLPADKIPGPGNTAATVRFEL